MTLDLWLAFTVASFILLITPGPTILLVVSYAISLGKREAVAMVAGVAVGDFIAMSITVLGVGAMMMASPSLFTIMKWGGALYLAWMGWRMLRSAPAATANREKIAAISSSRAFFDAAFVTVLNPKSIGFFVAFVPQFLTTERPLAPQFSVMVITFVGLGAANALAYALAAGRARDLLATPVALLWLHRLGGIILILMGVVTALLQRV